MRISDFIHCNDYPCHEARQTSYQIPEADLDPERIRLILISETTPEDPRDGYYGGDEAMFARTTLQAFREGGLNAASVQELLERGIYLTTAVKCGKYGYAVGGSIIANCSALLEREIEIFTSAKAFLLMGDVAIKAMNTIAKRQGEPRVVPAGSTYKIRTGEFTYRGRRVFPSYLQAGPSYGIEKSKQRMIAEDVAAGLRTAGIL